MGRISKPNMGAWSFRLRALAGLLQTHAGMPRVLQGVGDCRSGSGAFERVGSPLSNPAGCKAAPAKESGQQLCQGLKVVPVPSQIKVISKALGEAVVVEHEAALRPFHPKVEFY
jgi:hypothetical protein